MTNGKRKGENGKLSAPRSFFTDPSALRAPSPNLGEESGCGLVSGFKFQVLRYFVPLSLVDEDQSSGGGMFLRSPPIRSLLIFTDPSALRAPPLT